MDVRGHLPLEELVRLERVEKNAARSKRLRIVILAIGGYTAPAIAMSVGLSRRICQRWVARYICGCSAPCVRRRDTPKGCSVRG